MPSTNHNGSCCAPFVPLAVDRCALAVISNWNAWTSSWPITWSVAASDPASGRTIRRRSDSVTPPVPSPSSPSTTLVCRNAAGEA